MTVSSTQRLTGLFGILLLLQGSVLVTTLWLAASMPTVSLPTLATSATTFSSTLIKGSVPDQLLNETTNTIIIAEEPPATSAEPSYSSTNNVPAKSEIALTEQSATEETPSVLYTVSAGDTWASLWKKFDAPNSGALKAAAALRKHEGSLASLRVGEEIEVILDGDNDITKLVRNLADGRQVIIEGSAVNGYAVTEIAAQIVEEKRVATGVIKSSLAMAAAEQQVPASIVDDFVDLFSGRIEFRKDLQPGDTFTIEYLERHCARTGTTLKPGKITSASLKSGGTLMAAIRHVGDDGRESYFDETGKPLGNSFLRYPVKFSRISSTFSYARFHPVLLRTRPHNGVDFAAPEGTPVRAVADGVVEIASYRGQAGNMVRITHGERWATAYLHMQKISSELKPGARVRRGQVIGAVGSTGLSTGPHLHFSLYDHGNYVDPMKAQLPTSDDSIKPLPRQYLLAALENLNLQHSQIAISRELAVGARG